jgi:hypothetical protein
MMTFFVFYSHREASTLANDIPEESDMVRFRVRI